ncbi:DUF7359 domain-containing protein, partial [Bacillus subtilis]|uniref:DUF7359 domain-containing protein n=1 Tax=Bacillus subtilis TaxID=1423 RepID=UPI003F4D4A9A
MPNHTISLHPAPPAIPSHPTPITHNLNHNPSLHITIQSHYLYSHHHKYNIHRFHLYFHPTHHNDHYTFPSLQPTH